MSEGSSDIFGTEGQAAEAMDLPEMNLDEIKEGFEKIPLGGYHCIVQSCTPSVPKDAETDEDKKARQFLAWRFEIQEPEELKGRLLFLNTSLQPQARWKLKQVLAAIGEDVTATNYRPTPLNYVGRDCLVIVDGHRVWQGQEREQVGTVRPWDPTADNVLDA